LRQLNLQVVNFRLNELYLQYQNLAFDFLDLNQQRRLVFVLRRTRPGGREEYREREQPRNNDLFDYNFHGIVLCHHCTIGRFIAKTKTCSILLFLPVPRATAECNSKAVSFCLCR